MAFCFGYQIGFANDWCEAIRYDGKQNQERDRRCIAFMVKKQENLVMTENKQSVPKTSTKKRSKGYRKYIRQQKQAARKLGTSRT